jgi:hypothetical protein
LRIAIKEIYTATTKKADHGDRNNDLYGLARQEATAKEHQTATGE